MFKQIAKRETRSNSKGYSDSTKRSLKETHSDEYRVFIYFV